MGEWVLFMHPPRDDFIATMTDAERSAFDAHAAWLRTLLADGVLIVAGPCLGQVNTGIAIFEAPDEDTARGIVADEPVTSGGYMRGKQLSLKGAADEQSLAARVWTISEQQTGVDPARSAVAAASAAVGSGA